MTARAAPASRISLSEIHDTALEYLDGKSRRDHFPALTAEVFYRHPLNCEPPLSMLMDKGFITPVSLHYVRNHGAVPKLDWDTHKVKVEIPNVSRLRDSLETAWKAVASQPIVC